jgi:hypothetical protein
MKNKKVLFFVQAVAVLVLPLVVSGAASQAETFACNIRGAMYLIAGSIIVIGWVIAGILYLTSIGDPSKITKAKQAMVAAIIGTALIVIATMAGGLIANLLNLTAPTTSC